MKATGNLSPPPSFDPIADKSMIAFTTWRNWFSQIYTKIGGAGSSDFNPILSTDGTTGTPSYSIQLGRYTSIGTVRMVEFDLELSAWAGSPTGNVVIGNLPQAFLNSGGAAAIAFYKGITLGASHTQLGISASVGNNYANLYSFGSGALVTQAKIPVSNVSSIARISGTILYSV